MPSEISSYRSEVGGLYGIALFLHKLHEIYDLHGGHITVACDCKGAMERATSNSSPNPNFPDFDLYSEIHSIRARTPIFWSTRWVKGHQDDNNSLQELDEWAKLNIEMDALAKEHWGRLNLNRPAPFSLPSNDGVWSIWSYDIRITRWDNATADQLFFNSKTRYYWREKFEHLPVLDYEAIRTAYESINLFYQLRVPKWIGRRLPVGVKTTKWIPGSSDLCPRCGTASETQTHVLQCEHPGAITLVNNWLDQLELWLATQHTKPELRFGVISILRAAFRSRPWYPPNTSDPDIRNTFNQQQRIGLRDIIYGWWHIGWAEAQHTYLLSISRRTTGRRWLSRLIKKQWEIAWDLWRHRLQVAASPDSFSLSLAHEQLNNTIRALYARLSTTTYHPLKRWFRQPQAVVLLQTLAFKQDWVTMVQSFHGPAR